MTREQDWRTLGAKVTVRWSEAESTRLLARTLQRRRRQRVTFVATTCVAAIVVAASAAVTPEIRRPTWRSATEVGDARNPSDLLVAIAAPSPPPRFQSMELQVLGDAHTRAAHSLSGSAPVNSQRNDRAAEELMRTAEEARRSLDVARAQKHLEALLAQHRSSPLASIAAFNLGRYALERSELTSAAKSFALCRQLSPKGALAEDALAFELRAEAKRGNAAKASALAREYLSRYPLGHFADEARTAMR